MKRAPPCKGWARFKVVEHLSRNCCLLQKFVRPKAVSIGFGGLKFTNIVAFGGNKIAHLSRKER